MTRHGIGTTPNITKPCGYCGGNGYVLDPKPGDPGSGGDSKPCPDCDGSGAEVVMKGGTPRIEDGAEVGGELSPEGVGHPPTADLSAEVARLRRQLDELSGKPSATAFHRDRAEKAEAHNRALVEALRELDEPVMSDSVRRAIVSEALSGQGVKPRPTPLREVIEPPISEADAYGQGEKP